MTLTINLPKRGSAPGTSGLTCVECSAENCSSLTNGRCVPCSEVVQKAWTAKMAIRQDPTQFDMDKLVRLMLTDHWMHECQIITDFMPKFPRPDTQPTCVIRYEYDNKSDTDSDVFLRYSKGPLQGYFWDMYGDDFHSPELALLALSRASAPPRVGVVIATHGN